MVSVYGILFFIVLGGTSIITLSKLYNIYNYFTTDEIYSLFTNILSFVGCAVLWLFGLMVLLDNPLILLYNITFRFISFLLLINLVLFIIELFCCMGWAAQKVQIKAYSARDERAKLMKY